MDDGLLKDACADAADDQKDRVDCVEEMLLSGQPKDLGTYTFATIFFHKVYNDPNRKRKIKKAIMITIPVMVALFTVSIILMVLDHQR